jgi:hypothetical protein
MVQEQQRDSTTREQSQEFHFRVSPKIMATLDKIRRREPDLPSRAEMLRRLVLKEAK